MAAETAIAADQPFAGIQILLLQVHRLQFLAGLDIGGIVAQELESNVVDRRFIDGSLTGAAGWIRSGGRELGLVESGYFRSYILVFVGGAVVAGLVVLWRAST